MSMAKLARTINHNHSHHPFIRFGIFRNCSVICSLTRRLGVTTKTLRARSKKALAIRTAVLPEPVGIVTIAGSVDLLKCAAMACRAPACAIRKPELPAVFAKGNRKSS